MSTPSAPEGTRFLVAWRADDTDAFDRLVPPVYRELHKLARTACLEVEATSCFARGKPLYATRSGSIRLRS